MRVKRILNRVEKHQSFVFARVRWGDPEKCSLQVEVRARANSRPVCSGCRKPGPGYDALLGREFEFEPLWGIPVRYLYATPRVQCGRCGVKVGRRPWAEGKQTLTWSYMQFLATWAQRLSWLEVALFFHTSWEKVFRCVS